MNTPNQTYWQRVTIQALESLEAEDLKAIWALADALENSRNPDATVRDQAIAGLADTIKLINSAHEILQKSPDEPQPDA